VFLAQKNPILQTFPYLLALIVHALEMKIPDRNFERIERHSKYPRFPVAKIAFEMFVAYRYETFGLPIPYLAFVWLVLALKTP